MTGFAMDGGAPAAYPLEFARRLVAWQQVHGRHALPWQQTRDPYRVWLSEVMLQQTQVATVLSYYTRFVDRFPDVRALASAPLDDVLAMWSGLGYYSRARNLHRCAQRVVMQHGGVFPRAAATLELLPGIGRSTAAAVAAFCFDERVAILDANVRRVLCRVLGFGEDLALARNTQVLWQHATALLPEPALAHTMPGYTQALMDLGATVCLPRKPNCVACPVQDICVAFREGQPQAYPVRSRTLRRTAESLWLLWGQRPDGAVWLQRRPSEGVWAGLFCLPVFASREAVATALPGDGLRVGERAVVKHVLTHKDLYLHPVVWNAREADVPYAEGEWVAADVWPQMGLPAPVRRMLEGMPG